MRYSGVLGCVLACVATPLAAKEYTVQRGDTLSTIADRELGRSSAWRELCEINNLPNCDRIVVGMTLRLTAAADHAEGIEVEHDAADSGQISDSRRENIHSEANGGSPDQAARNPDAIFVEVYSLDSPLGLPIETQNQFDMSRTDLGVELSGHVSDPRPGWRTGGAFIRLTDDFEKAASGNRVRIEIEAYGNKEGNFIAAYSTADVGNSGWQSLPIGLSRAVSSFEYDVRPLKDGNGDFLGIVPDPKDDGQTITIKEIRAIVLYSVEK